MSKQWNQVSSASESSLLEVMAEELRNRLHIDEDFVWVEMAEGNPPAEAEPSESFPLTGNKEHQTSSIDSYSISNVVQPNIDCDREISDRSDCESDSQEDEDEQEAEYVNQCIKNKVKPFKHPRLKYRQPYMLKIRERGVYNVEKRLICKEQNEKKNHEQNNKLLPIQMKFDASTTAVLEMAINNGYLGQFNELIHTGRNHVVFHAYCGNRRIKKFLGRNVTPIPHQNAVKIYKTSKDEEKNKIIYKHVQKEFEHLKIISKLSFKIFHCHITPWPVRAWKNVIITGFFGFCNTIEDAPHENDKDIYNFIIDSMDKWYNIANLVHGKLSVKNIYWLIRNIPYITGWSHSVKRGHPLALIKLMKDCNFVTEFYKERGLLVKSATDLFKQITKQEIIDDEVLKIVCKDLYKKYKSNPNRKTSHVKSNTNKRFNDCHSI